MEAAVAAELQRLTEVNEPAGAAYFRAGLFLQCLSTLPTVSSRCGCHEYLTSVVKPALLTLAVHNLPTA